MNPLRKSFLLTLFGLALIAAILWGSWATGASDGGYASETESVQAQAQEGISTPKAAPPSAGRPGDLSGALWMPAAE